MTFQKSLSCRIAEGFLSKEEASLSFAAFAELAKSSGYDAVCMRASQIGIHTPKHEVLAARQILDDLGLQVSMITGDFDIVYNNNRGPNCLRNLAPYLELAEQLASPLIRVCIKQEDDIPWVRKGAAMAAERGIKLVHQCHVQSLFERIPDIIARIQQIDHPNFGIIFEAANLEQCGQDYGLETIQSLSPWMENVYLQNQRIRAGGAVTLDTWCAGPVTLDVCEIPDEGGIDFATIFVGLRSSGYEGYVTVHQSAPESPHLTTHDTARQTAQFLDGLLA